MITFDLIRHGESEAMVAARKAPVPVFGGRMRQTKLSSEGKEQARLFGIYAKQAGIEPNAVFASPAERTLETHRISRKVGGWNVPFDTHDDLIELDWGQWEGKPRTTANNPQWRRSRLRLGGGFQPPGGESFADVRRRSLRALQKIAGQVPDGSYVWIITHQNVIKSIVLPFRAWDPDTLLRVSVAPLSRTLLTYDEEARGQKLHLRFFNRPTVVLS